jgi:hypothetical protein
MRNPAGTRLWSSSFPWDVIIDIVLYSCETLMAFLQICFVQLLACSLNALSIRIVYLPPLTGGAMFF